MKGNDMRGFIVDSTTENKNVLFGGECLIKGAISPNTNLPLTQFACVTLDSKKINIPKWELPQIHFLYSWKCKIHEGDFSYRYINDELVVIEFCSGEENYDGFPYDDYPVIFEKNLMGLKEISNEEQEIILTLNNIDCEPDFKFENTLTERMSIPMHQFGGVPYLFDPEASNKKCRVCGEDMPMVASIANESYSDNEGFHGNDFVQIVYFACATCKVVSALNFSD